MLLSGSDWAAELEAEPEASIFQLLLQLVGLTGNLLPVIGLDEAEFPPLLRRNDHSLTRVERIGSGIVTTFTNIDGGADTQTYTCPTAPVTGGTGIGISGFAGGATIDNFAAGPGAAPAGPPTVVPTLTQFGLMVLGGLLFLSVLLSRRRR